MMKSMPRGAMLLVAAAAFVANARRKGLRCAAVCGEGDDASDDAGCSDAVFLPCSGRASLKNSTEQPLRVTR